MLSQAVYAFQSMLIIASNSSLVDMAVKFFPFVLLIEVPLYLLVLSGLVRFGMRVNFTKTSRLRYPHVTCIITCYSEGLDVQRTIRSLVHQNYPGTIDIVPVIDGALQNANTLAAARACQAEFTNVPRRRVMVLPKWQRGGRVSSLNTGLSLAKGEIVMALDGDTSFDTDMVTQATKHFDNPNVVGVAGALRVRNVTKSLVTRLQGLEYALSISAGRSGLSEYNLVTNISGAFGVFRTSFLRGIGGWDSGTAEDLDLTLRIKQYFGRHRDMRIVFEPHAVGHTDVPDTFHGFYRQRLRWEGDLFYVYVRKYARNIRPSLLGWANTLFVLVGGLFMQVLMPFVIIGYTVLMCLAMPAGVLLGLSAFIYLFYLTAVSITYTTYLVAISERKREDLRFLAVLPLLPLFAFSCRVHSAFAILQEILLSTHLDSAMAPWWVLRKTRF
ncbi:MAG: glycosyltransferase [Leptothrix sp. (in: b-proteobacteria)]